MSTENAATGKFGGLGVKWYHLLLAIAFGAGGGILPPGGAVTYAGWAGGILGSLTSALIVAGIVLGSTRLIDDWRPTELVGQRSPDSRIKYVVLAALSAQLFVFGTTFAADTSLGTTVFLVSAINPVVGLAVTGDMLRLRSRGIDWNQLEWGLSIASFLVGIGGGLAYWYRRGRKRTMWTATDDEATTDAATVAEADTTSKADTDTDTIAGTGAETDPRPEDSVSDSTDTVETEEDPSDELGDSGPDNSEDGTLPEDN